jgi:hypothetical protein
VTAQDQKPMDYRDFLLRQREQERIRQQFEGLFSKSDSDHAADQADHVSQQAYDTADACAIDASEVEDALTEVMMEARDLREPISSGVASEKDAREALANLRKRRAKLVARPRRSRLPTRAPSRPSRIRLPESRR